MPSTGLFLRSACLNYPISTALAQLSQKKVALRGDSMRALRILIIFAERDEMVAKKLTLARHDLSTILD